MAKESAVQKYGYILEKREEFIKYFKGDEKEEIQRYYDGMQWAYIEYCTEILHGKLYSPQPTLGSVIATGGESYKEYKDNRETVNASRAAISMKKANVEDYYQVIAQMLEEKNLYTRPLSSKERQVEKTDEIVGYVLFAFIMLTFALWMMGYGGLLAGILFGVGIFIFLVLNGKG